jgi:hypothetical protein
LPDDRRDNIFMKRFLLAIFIFISLYSSAQQWIKTYGNGLIANWVTEDYDKGFIILGTKITYQTAWIIKTDINGNLLWNKQMGNGSYEIVPETVELTSDNGLIIGGTMSKYGNQEDAFILKLNTCGELEWCRDIYTPNIGNDLGWRARQTNDNGYILLGLYNNPNPNLRTNLFKFDSWGNLLWHQAYLPDSAAFEDDPDNILTDSEGIIITAKCYYPDPGQSGGWERFYLIKTDTAGNKIWSCIYGKDSYYYGYPQTTLSGQTGNYYALGKHDVINPTSDENPAIIKVLHDGTPSYNKDVLIHIFEGKVGTGVMVDDTTLIMISCRTVASYNSGNAFLKTDTLGNLKDSMNLPNTSSAIYAMAKTSDNKFITIATDCPNNCHIVAYKVNSDLQWDSIYTHQYTYDNLCPHSIVSDTIDPNCQLVVNVEEPLTNPGTCQIKVFPNPADERLTVVFPKYLQIMDNSPPVKSTTIYHQWNKSALEVYSMNGEKIFQKDIPKDQTQLEMNVSTWPRGMYFFRLLYNKQSVAGEKVILK